MPRRVQRGGMSERDHAAPASGHHARRHPLRWFACAVAGAALLAAAGCGGASSAAPASSAQRWQQCLRAHGVTVPSAGPGPGPTGPPSPATGGQPPSLPGGPPSGHGQGSPGMTGPGLSAKDRAARAACQKYAPQSHPGRQFPSVQPSALPGGSVGAGPGGMG